jgi:Tfp pilus assembly protein PilF
LKKRSNDPRNANAYVARATSYFFTPEKFGGSKEKAVDMLKKAIAAEPGSDAAQTAYVWLVVVYQSLGQKENAVSEITQALKLNPERSIYPSRSKANSFKIGRLE